ncbi:MULTISPECIES: helix-turn-helix domain-containing protein [Acidiplasma]|jgi:predicted DNA binding protein|uniref:HTH bat-type domain-containing protein n=1 Tax=Acidiplasma cupricumulans TaxID=312540 RepID=A0A0Q0VRP4_9ARCH|nr:MULTISPECIES: helix-turn-helix domain-containing protein [Acidiplasma]KQB36539.1 hypothetical protein AOG55_00270 [Acidiplasma cupricumulans]
MDVTYIFKYDRCFASNLIQNYHIKMRLISRSWDTDQLMETVSIYSESPEIINKTADFLKNYNDFEHIDILDRTKNTVTFRVTVTTSCPIIDVLKSSLVKNKKNPLIERIDYKGNTHWKVEVDNCAKVDKIAEILREKYKIEDVDVKIHRGRKSDTKSLYVLKQAYEMGYFDVPKRIGLDKLSEELHIPQTTLNLMLRRSLRQLINENLK